MPLDAKQQALLKTIATSVSTPLATALSKLLDTQVTITLGNIGAAKTQGAQANIATETALATAALGEESFGNINILTSTEDAASIANLMSGSTEAGGDFNAEKAEAFASALSQGFADALAHIDELQDPSFTPGNFNVKVLDPADPGSLNLEDGDQEKAGIQLSIKTASGLSFNASIDLSTELINGLAMIFPAATGAKASSGDTVGDVLGADFGQIVDSHNPEDVDERKNLNLLMDIRLGLIVELGRAEMHLKDILKLTKGSIIELDRLSGEAVDLFVNNKLIARGEVVVIDDNFGLRITQLAGLNNSADIAMLMGEDG